MLNQNKTQSFKTKIYTPDNYNNEMFKLRTKLHFNAVFTTITLTIHFLYEQNSKVLVISILTTIINRKTIN